MDSKGPQSSKEKKNKRKEVLEKKKAIDEIIKAASSVKDHLAFFTPFCKYDRHGLMVCLESGFGDQLSSPMKQCIQNMLKINMEGVYGSDWPAEEKEKRRDMVSPEARYIFVRQSPKSISDENSRDDEKMTYPDSKDCIVGFLHYRFVVEEDVPVLYIYELQLESCL